MILSTPRRLLVAVFTCLLSASAANAFVTPTGQSGRTVIEFEDPDINFPTFVDPIEDSSASLGPLSLLVESFSPSSAAIEASPQDSPSAGVSGTLNATAVALNGLNEFSTAEYAYEFSLSQTANYSLVIEEVQGLYSFTLSQGDNTTLVSRLIAIDFADQGQLEPGDYRLSLSTFGEAFYFDPGPNTPVSPPDVHRLAFGFALTAVPEPGSIALLLLAASPTFLARRRSA